MPWARRCGICKGEKRSIYAHGGGRGVRGRLISGTKSSLTSPRASAPSGPRARTCTCDLREMRHTATTMAPAALGFFNTFLLSFLTLYTCGTPARSPLDAGLPSFFLFFVPLAFALPSLVETPLTVLCSLSRSGAGFATIRVFKRDISHNFFFFSYWTRFTLLL